MEQTHIDQNCIIGKYSYIGRNCNLTKVSIGNYCSIANNVSIGQGEHNLFNISTSSFFYHNSYEELTQKECTIGHDVWIGTDSIILRGVKIGTGSIIGANSVVTKDVPPYSIVVGVPAKVIKYRFKDEMINRILKTKWWEFDKIDAEKIIKKLEVYE